MVTYRKTHVVRSICVEHKHSIETHVGFVFSQVFHPTKNTWQGHFHINEAPYTVLPVIATNHISQVHSPSISNKQSLKLQKFSNQDSAEGEENLQQFIFTHLI